MRWSSARLTFESGGRFSVGGVTTYRISQLAERSGVPATTLRFYETAGLLPAERTPSGYRVYHEDAVDRLAFISSAKLLGLALEEIRDLLDGREEGVCSSVRARMLPLVEDRIRETDGRIAELRAFTGHLAGVHAELSEPAPAGACGPDCGCTSAGTSPAGPVPVTLSPTRSAPDREGSWRDAPVACTLDGAELGERTEQWRTLVAKAGRREAIDEGVRLSSAARQRPPPRGPGRRPHVQPRPRRVTRSDANPALTLPGHHLLQHASVPCDQAYYARRRAGGRSAAATPQSTLASSRPAGTSS